MRTKTLYQSLTNYLVPSPLKTTIFNLLKLLSTVSIAASKAGAASAGIPLWKHYANLAGNSNPDTLPVPCFNVINGGEHAGNKLAFQEFFVIPTGAETFRYVLMLTFLCVSQQQSELNFF